jgi:hypothetical protein
MIKNISRPLLLLAGLLLAGFAQAQESVNASGGNATGSGGTVAFSVGQVVYSSNTGSTGAVDAGVQQAYEIFTVGIIQPDLAISLSVFPNPTVNDIILKTQSLDAEQMSFTLVDLQGKVLAREVVVKEQTQIQMNHLPAAIYFLQVYTENRNIQSFKIIKK